MWRGWIHHDGEGTDGSRKEAADPISPTKVRKVRKQRSTLCPARFLLFIHAWPQAVGWCCSSHSHQSRKPLTTCPEPVSSVTLDPADINRHGSHCLSRKITYSWSDSKGRHLKSISKSRTPRGNDNRTDDFKPSLIFMYTQGAQKQKTRYPGIQGNQCKSVYWYILFGKRKIVNS